MMLTPEKRYVNIRSKMSVGFIVCAFALAACSGSASIGLTPTDAPVSEEAPAEEANTEEAPAEEAPAADVSAEAAPIGELGASRSNPFTLDIPVSGSSLTITVTEIVSDADAAAKIVQDGFTTNGKAPEGFQYHVVRYTATNSATDKAPSNPWLNLTMYMTGSSLNKYAKPEDAWLPQTECREEIAAGVTVPCEVAFLIPIDETNRMLIIETYPTTAFLAIDEGAAISAYASTSAKSTSGSDTASPAAIGETVDITYDGVDISYTVNEIIRGDDAATRVAAECETCDKPAAGQEFILANITVIHYGDIKTPDIAFSPYAATFKTVGGMLVEYEGPSAYAPQPRFGSQPAVYAGGTFTGWVVLSAPLAETGRQIVIYGAPSSDAAVKRYIAIE